MSKNVEFLKEKSSRFYSNSLYLFQKGDYDLCAFNLEQSCQLLIKYLIAKRVGEWPKTHYLEILMKSLSEAYDRVEIYNYYLENELFFSDLSDAYFTSRYFPKPFTKSLSETLMREYKKFISFLEATLDEKLDFDK
ncbi:HEPN domain-containing protein [Pseudothermotoga sp. U03pept]|uniref:HEPN domain-containing protein n=1 Tax=Pseudothermotoga sp. U03pept TaxID=3447012 RepID=UPI003F08B2CB